LNDPKNAGFDLELAAAIDHTLLKPEATVAPVEKLCQEASDARFAAVCVHPIWVSRCAAYFDQLGTKTPAVCTVVGFPHGAQPAAAKACETELACKHGATEIDMVIPIGALLDGDTATVSEHVAAVVKASGKKALVKVIIENCYLSNAQIIDACRICVDNGADYVKTSTGFGSGGATLDDVRLMRKTVGPDIGVKAAGGIRDRDTAWEFLRAGATRIGTSSGLSLCRLD
jgi:deoxyribose-phosphate aldolase